MVSLRDTEPAIEATPALVVDLALVERNIHRLAQYAKPHRIGIRPHTKTHKSLRIARLQVAAGAIGLTAAKVGEAEIMADASPDILIAYPALDRHRARRIAELARRATVHVAIDSAYAANALAAAAAAGTQIGILVDLDVGSRRTGVQSPEASLDLARHIDRAKSLRLDGLFFYPGQVWSPADQQAAELAAINDVLATATDLWKRAGLAAPIVSGGSTPTAYQSHLLRAQTEIRPGTYPFNDMNTVRAGFCSLDDVAAAVVCTVVSNAVPGKAVIDAGTKTLTSDRNVKFPDSGYGHVLEFPDARITRLSEEHGELDITHCPRPPALGQRVTVIPNHICPCVNLQDHFYLRHPDGSFEPSEVDTRGRLS